MMWTGTFFHDEKGKVLGEIMQCGNKYKALQNSMFLGWFVNEIFAKNAVEEAWKFENNKSTKPEPPQNLVIPEYELLSNALVPKMSGWNDKP